MSGMQPRALLRQTVWPALAGIAQAASIAWPGSGQALGWLQVLSLTLFSQAMMMLPLVFWALCAILANVFPAMFLWLASTTSVLHLI